MSEGFDYGVRDQLTTVTHTVRQMLKRDYPGTRFTVRADRSNGPTVSVRYYNGPGITVIDYAVGEIVNAMSGNLEYEITRTQKRSRI